MRKREREKVKRNRKVIYRSVLATLTNRIAQQLTWFEHELETYSLPPVFDSPAFSLEGREERTAKYKVTSQCVSC